MIRWSLPVFAAGVLLASQSPASAQSNSVSPALAPRPAACGNLIDVFALRLGVQPYQPLLVFEPAYRVTHPDAREPQELPLNITVKVADFPLEIGNYKVSNVPFLNIVPRSGTEAHFFTPNGERCTIPTSAFSDRTFLAAWGYGVGRLALYQGDSLDINFASALPWSSTGRDQTPKIQPDSAPNGGVPCQSSNLHTHGLLVPPWRGDDVDRAFGDFVLDVAVPGFDPKAKHKAEDGCGLDSVHGALDEEHGKMHYRITLPAVEGSDPTLSGTHPSGLYWFHPHPHGYSAAQVRGGTTGLITIGSIRDYAASALSSEVGQATNLRYLMLKDAQIVATGPRTWAYSYDYGADLCEKPDDAKDPRNAKHVFAFGECTNKDVKAPEDPDARWVYTVNGVQYPHFHDLRPNERELLRIANASSNVTYNLALRRVGREINDDAEGTSCTDGANGTPKFHLISKDGVAIDSRVDPATPAIKSLCADRLLMMPGTRVEVVLNPIETGGDFELVTLPVDTGADVWPGMVLARITIPPSSIKNISNLVVNGARPSASIAAGKVRATASPDRLLQPMATSAGVPMGKHHNMPMSREMNMPGPVKMPEAGAPVVAAPEPIVLQPADFKHPCMWSSDWERVILLVKKKATVAPAPGAKPGDPLPEPNEEFGILSGIRKRGESSQNAVFVTKDGHYQKRFGEFGDLFNPDNAAYNPGFGNDFDFGFVCTSIHDEAETWVVENWTDEIHNFHIHQSKFSPLNARDAEFNKPEYFSFPAEGDLTRQMQRYYESATTDAYVDSVPVPMGSSATDACNAKPGNDGCTPGRISIKIQFTRLEQIGDFVFHCHILEHEDRGMMTQIHVAPRLVAHTH